MEWFAKTPIISRTPGTATDWRVSHCARKSLQGSAGGGSTAWFDPLPTRQSLADALAADGVATKYHRGEG